MDHSITTQDLESRSRSEHKMSSAKAQDDIEPLAVPLWPDTGRALGLGKNRTYDLGLKRARSLPFHSVVPSGYQCG